MGVQFDLSSMAVLVVDDTSLMLANLKKILVCMGFKEENIFLAENGADALANIAKIMQRKGKLDLIICDWDMPKASGLEVLNMIRNVPSTKKIPFLMVTGHSKKEDVVLALQSGVDCYVLKPFRERVFQDKVLEALAKGIAQS